MGNKKRSEPARIAPFADFIITQRLFEALSLFILFLKFAFYAKTRMRDRLKPLQIDFIAAFLTKAIIFFFYTDQGLFKMMKKPALAGRQMEGLFTLLKISGLVSQMIGISGNIA